MSGQKQLSNLFASKVEADEARKGRFIKSFPLGQKREMLLYCQQLRLAMRRKDIPGRLVYADIGIWTFNHTWQIFLLPERNDNG